MKREYRRYETGEVRGRWCKLTPNQVRLIRRLHLKGLQLANKYSVKSFAKKYKMGEGSIRDVINGRNWNHIS